VRKILQIAKAQKSGGMFFHFKDPPSISRLSLICPGPQALTLKRVRAERNISTLREAWPEARRSTTKLFYLLNFRYTVNSFVRYTPSTTAGKRMSRTERINPLPEHQHRGGLGSRPHRSLA